MDGGDDASGPDGGLDAPPSDDAGPRDASLPDASLPDAPGLDAPLPDAAEPDAAPADGGTCACPLLPLGECESERCEGVTCVREDDDRRCDVAAGQVCAGGRCVEGCTTCAPDPGGCQTAVCVGRTCVRSALTVCPVGQACIDGVCRAGACVNPTAGTIAPRGTVCRSPSLGSCQASAVCDGVSPDCPTTTAVQPAGTACGTAAAIRCRPPRVCDGFSAMCPDAEVFDWDASGNGIGDCADMAGVCALDGRCLVAGRCDAAPCVSGCNLGTVNCSASTPTCVPGGSHVPDGTPCGSSAGPCLSAPVCRGGSCGPGPDRGVCRPARAPCDVAEYCRDDAACPTDAFADGVVCRPSSNDCDLAEICDGRRADCPLDARVLDDTPCGLAQGCQKCRGGACASVAATTACMTDGGVTGQCSAIGECLEPVGGSCLVPGAPCAVGVLGADGCTITGPAPPDTVCAPGRACVLPSLCPGVGPSFECPPQELAATCTIDCGGVPTTADCVGAVCPAVCTAAL